MRTKGMMTRHGNEWSFFQIHSRLYTSYPSIRYPAMRDKYVNHLQKYDGLVFTARTQSSEGPFSQVLGVCHRTALFAAIWTLGG